MKISSQEEYGLRCLLQVARLSTEHPVPISEIAVQEGLSVEYAGKILMALRQGGLVASIRGKAGGYLLAQSATDITVRNVIDVLSGPFYDPSYCSRFSGTEDVCVHVSECGIRPIWSVVHRFIAESLDRITVADLLDSEIDASRHLLRGMRDQLDLMTETVETP